MKTLIGLVAGIGFTLSCASSSNAWDGFRGPSEAGGDWSRPTGQAAAADDPASENVCVQPEDPKRLDFELKLGIGFSGEEVALFERAAENWNASTGLAITVTTGHGLKGNVHLFDSLDACGEGNAHREEDALGCYIPAFDRLAFSRPGIVAFAKRLQTDSGAEANDDGTEMFRKALFTVFLHELGHWLGLPHANHGKKSIMVPSILQLFIGEGRSDHIWREDAVAVCQLDRCGDKWCR